MNMVFEDGCIFQPTKMDLLARQLYCQPAGTAAVPSNAKLRIWAWLTSLDGFRREKNHQMGRPMVTTYPPQDTVQPPWLRTVPKGPWQAAMHPAEQRSMSSPKDEARQPVRASRFEHLNGARCLAAFWIVCAHYMPQEEVEDGWSLSGRAYYRVNVAVCFFVLTSGFVTHWTSAAMTIDGAWPLLGFYLRRLGRVLLTFWLAMLWAVYLLKREGKDDLPLDYVVKCFCLIEQWFKWCPNGPSWFIFALLPSWLLYPLSRKVVQYVEDRGEGSGLLALAAASFLVSTGPGLFLLLVNGNITMQQHNDMMFWPPSQLADFLMGMTTAALVRRYKGTRLKALADLSMLLVLLVVFLLPRPPQTYEMHLNGWEPLLDHGLAPLLAGGAWSFSTVAAFPKKKDREKYQKVMYLISYLV
eukprot:s729_g16.t1